jgi:hypothetical protein
MEEPDGILYVRWDIQKAESNLRKHAVGFPEAETVFDDPLSVTKVDPDHSVDESRFITIGLSCKQRLLLVAHTEDSEEIRIISARMLTKSEREVYEND